MKDVRGEKVSQGDRILITRNNTLQLATLTHETSMSFVAKSDNGRKILFPKEKTSPHSVGWGYKLVDVSNYPYNDCLKVDKDFSL